MKRPLILLFALGLVGCLTDRQRSAGRDRDRDGFEAWELGGADCDDDEPSVNPDAEEVCANGLDDDCDGLVDDVGQGGRTWYIDLDGDGFTGSAPVYSCAAPLGGVTSASSQVDCDDGQSQVNPNAEEVWYDGVDQDCDGVDDDRDGDGFGIADDCDDGNEQVNPRAAEVCNNGVDDNCDGSANRCGPDFERTIEDAYAQLGGIGSVVRLVDVSGDGQLDLIVARDDVIRAYFSPLASAVPSGDADLVLHGVSDRIDGFDFGDFNGDDVMDWVVADAGEGRVAVWMSPDPAAGEAIVADLPALVRFGEGVHSGAPFGRMVRVVPGIRASDGDSLVVAHRGEAQSGSGDTLGQGVRYYRGPWTGLPLDGALPAHEVTGIEVNMLGWPHQLLLNRYLPILGSDAETTGVFPLSFPHNESTSLELLPAWFDLYATFNLSPNTDTVGFLQFPASWEPYRAPMLDMFILGVDTVNIGTVALQRTASLLDPDRVPVNFLGEMEWSAVNPVSDGEGSFRSTSATYCDQDTFGDILLSGLLVSGDQSTSAVRTASVEELVAPSGGAGRYAVRGAGYGFLACGDVTGDGIVDLVVSDVLTSAVVVWDGSTL